jgi:tetratricopeptide (TPR) repeat protein
MKTGMGQSFGNATQQKSAADFGEHAVVYDSLLDYYYHPFWRGDSLCIKEYRLEGKDTVHQRTQTINYIIGSGQHTNSHLFLVNHYLYQAPITFYTQKRKWDLAPGFEKGASSRFSRIIETECVTCHDGFPSHESNSLNKYNTIQTGIDCERCHGPGSLHVAAIQAGKITDTSKSPDYTIVNPRRLSTELQNNICQRCHLQGIAVLNDDKTFFDFRPGMKLSNVVNVFMPVYEGGEDKMIMASHVERMKKSRCYNESGKMSCITCHNPHVSVKFTPRTQYLNACNSCHGQNWKQCSEQETTRKEKNNDCITCHMPHNGSIDIPHVAVTDHFIRKRILSNENAGKIAAFLGLKSYNNDKPDAITKARAYMEFFERYGGKTMLVDSALFYLNQEKEREEKEKQNRDFVRAYFLLNDYEKVIDAAKNLSPEQLNDAWTAYRIGEAYFQESENEKALAFYQRAVELKKYALDFQNKYASCLLVLGKINEARKVFEFILQENPNHVAANTNLGFLWMQNDNYELAYQYMNTAKLLDPDYEQNLINLAVWHHYFHETEAAKKTLQHLLKKHPYNQQAQAMLADLK